MRIVAIPLALLLAAPTLTAAQARARPPPPATPAAQPEPAGTALAAPASSRPPRPPAPSSPSSPRPPPPEQGRPPPLPGAPWGPPPPVYYPPPIWWGFGWGYGYYPLYPHYGDAYPASAMAPVPPSQQVAATLRATGAAGTGESNAVGMAFGVESGRGGFDLAFDAFEPSQGGVMPGGSGGPIEAYGFASGHFAYPILDGPSYRIRLQAGGSWLSVPASSAYGNSTDAFGFDLGASATLGLFGPIGVEGHARITPYPVQVVDLRAAVALRAGSFSLLGGYRVIDVAADPRIGPSARFEGPEFGFGLIF